MCNTERRTIMGQKDCNRRHWSQKELKMMEGWIKNNPTVNPGFSHGHKELNEMLPDQNPQQIYFRWSKISKRLYGGKAPIARGYRGLRRPWNEEELFLLETWVQEKGGAYVLSCTEKDIKELAELIPSRTISSIMSKLKRMQADKRRKEGRVMKKNHKEQGEMTLGVQSGDVNTAIIKDNVVLDNSNTNGNGIMGYISACLEGYVNTKIMVGIEAASANCNAERNGELMKLKEQVDKLTDENEKLKGLLRKLTKVREAVQEFQKTL